MRWIGRIWWLLEICQANKIHKERTFDTHGFFVSPSSHGPAQKMLRSGECLECLVLVLCKLFPSCLYDHKTNVNKRPAVGVEQISTRPIAMIFPCASLHLLCRRVCNAIVKFYLGSTSRDDQGLFLGPPRTICGGILATSYFFQKSEIAFSYISRDGFRRNSA